MYLTCVEQFAQIGPPDAEVGSVLKKVDDVLFIIEPDGLRRQIRSAQMVR